MRQQAERQPSEMDSVEIVPFVAQLEQSIPSSWPSTRHQLWNTKELEVIQVIHLKMDNNWKVIHFI